MDRSTALQQGTREFAGVYERNAYTIYNLALRTALDRAAAVEAACAAFLACLSSDDPDDELPVAATRRALQLARETPSLEAAGDADAQAMLRASAELPAPERATLALIGIGGADTAQVAAALGITAEAAQALTERARWSFAGALGVSIAAADEAYRRWLWAEPPAELWEQLYPSFYEQLVRRLNSSDEAPTVAVAAVAAAARPPSRGERRQARRAERDARRAKPPGRVRRLVRAVPVGRVAMLAVMIGGVAGLAFATGLLGGSRSAPAAAGLTRPGHQLSPAELASLRAQQRQAELQYQAQQRISERQLKAQQAIEQQASKHQRAQQLGAARAAAKRRAAALKRAQQLAAQQQALQAKLNTSSPAPASPTPQPSSPSRSGSPSGSGGGSSSNGGSGKPTTNGGSGSGNGSTNPTPSQVQQQCLYNANNGTWVCPQK